MSIVRTITATTLSRYVRLERCDRFLWFRLKMDETNKLQQKLGVKSQPLSPLLSEAGETFEQEVIQNLGSAVQSMVSSNVEETLRIIASLEPGENCLLAQSILKATIGGWPCEGRSDLIKVTRQNDGSYEVVVGDVKASNQDRVEYRLQVAFYLRVLYQMMTQQGLIISKQKGIILRKKEDGSLPQLDDAGNTFDLEPYNIVLSQLLEGEEAELTRLDQLRLNDLPYCLSYKCDGCTYNQLCMTDSNQRQDIALVPFIQPASTRALKANGINTLKQLAELKILPAHNAYNTTFKTTPGKEALVNKLSQFQPLGTQLDRLVQRARARLKQFDPSVMAHPHLLDGSFSTLPGDEPNSELVKIFLDAQHDFVQNRLYLVGALIKGPDKEKKIVELTPGPPDAASEETLLINFLGKLLTAIQEVAVDPLSTPLHLYIFDSYEQKVWLDAFDRHLNALCAIPIFFDLITTSPALEQPMLGVLSSEIRERQNLPLTCQNLYSIATLKGFKWQDGELDFRRLFNSQVFDNTLKREDGIWVQRFSRFDSHIPLEYAYGAWGKLPPKGTGSFELYQNCKPEYLLRFEVSRLAAMAYIEGGLSWKDNRLVKEQVAFSKLETDPPTTGLARALEEFLLVEHHTKVQQLLTLYGLPIERRIIGGRSLLLKCLEVEGKASATFELDYAAAKLPESTRQALRFKEGDWLIFNPIDGRPFWRIMYGRIAIVSKLEGNIIELQLLDMTSFRSRFKYSHDLKIVPVPGEYYTLDEMADELNADKHREAVLNSNNNIFFSYLKASSPPIGEANSNIASRQFLECIAKVDPANLPTEAQAQVIAGHHKTPLLCVQGPPGTGKTATLGWAVLARLFSRQERPLRVAVCARTHKATNLVLESISKKLQKLKDNNRKERLVIGPLKIYKVGSGEAEKLPDGIQKLNSKIPAAAVEAFAHPLTIIGGTPGGIYSLLKQRAGGKLDWAGEKIFDLVIIDEASQMSLPEAVLAGAWLKSDGQMIVVGDHRQMPPILAHEWGGDRRRSATTHQPFRSVFESLIELNFPCVALNESFRLHRIQAEFLALNIYSRDNINFYSKKEHLLQPLPDSVTDEYARAVLRSDYPVIVIEHGESNSQQYNETEIKLVEPLIEICHHQLGLEGKEGIGVVVPHNAQKAFLKERFPELAKADAIDTVERFQGGERDVIIVSATASDPAFILAEADFLLNLNRLNVAISRPKKKLIVVASSSIFRLIVDDLNLFENAILWKRLRYQWTNDLLWQGVMDGHSVRVWGRPCGHTIPDVIRSANINNGMISVIQPILVNHFPSPSLGARNKGSKEEK